MDADAPTIRSLSRGLAVLRVINRAGPLNLTDIAHATGIAHATTARIVRTLEVDGVVERMPGTRRYRATALALALSCGFQNHDRLVTIARPAIEALTDAVGWPAALLTRAGGAMIVRDSTVGRTSLTFHVYDPGVALPIFASAAGRAFFAFSGPEEQTEMLAHGADATATALFGDGSLAATIRRQGYAALASVDTEARLRGNAAIAVPILSDGGLVGALSLVYFARAMPLAKAVDRLLPSLRDAAAAISRSLDASADAQGSTPAGASRH